jgi:hypothetical protein
MDFAKISNYTIEIYFVLFYFGQRLYLLNIGNNLMNLLYSILARLDESVLLLNVQSMDK